MRAGPSPAHCHALLGLFRYATRNAQPRDASVRQANSLRRECLSLPVSRIARARPQPDDVDCDVVLKNGTYTPSWRPLAWIASLAISGDIAQWLARPLCMRKAPGSNPGISNVFCNSARKKIPVSRLSLLQFYIFACISKLVSCFHVYSKKKIF